MGIEIVVIRVVTGCTNEDELVATFAPLSSDKTLFIPTRVMRLPGVETGFSIRLADGSPKLRGLCVVLGSYPDADNAWRRPGVQLGIRKLTPDSTPVFARLRDPQEVRATIEMAPLFDASDESDLTERVAIARETILGMPPVVPPRKDTVKMPALVFTPPRVTVRAPVAVIDEDVVAIRLPWRARVTLWLARLRRWVSARREPRAYKRPRLSREALHAIVRD
jgi:hypothetical protein